MAYKIIISPEAYRELDLAECYFKFKGLSKEFLEDFNIQLSYLEQMPLSRQKRYKNIRIHLFDKFSYSIHYVVMGYEVRVLHILSQKQGF
ncbi:hypothetical protein OOZ15_08210 [Galbibacter sp. EGI 63066]|uniref:hypothetical protein n=1 Tax=Galbibacter sp. EGI 63066 TaxID=2993559 RepID=UPI0022489F8D|nr:hypothetical protein [Galbibacter sp. EGI 63066]MCX2679916.1 hypothetical protein [Galbibacter sp. EGI 63066]